MLPGVAVRAFVDLPSGVALRIGSAGLLIGRHRSCDIQLEDDTASRRHALLRVVPEGVELIVLGRQPVRVDGRPCAGAELLPGAARLSFPGFDCNVRVERVEEDVPVDYCLRRGLDRIPIRTSPFVIGSGASAQVVVAGWPAEALRFQVAQGQLYLDIEGGEVAPLHVGDHVEYAGEMFRIEHAAEGNTSTRPLADMKDRLAAAIEKVAREAGPVRATEVVLEPLPRGGRVTFRFADGDRRVYLPGRRFQLISALVSPPPPLRVGEFVPDSEVVSLVWDDDDSVGGRADINVLLTRCRQDLVAAGIDPASLLERAPGGRATRLLLAPGAKVRAATESE
jgi:hypothetical protein